MRLQIEVTCVICIFDKTYISTWWSGMYGSYVYDVTFMCTWWYGFGTIIMFVGYVAFRCCHLDDIFGTYAFVLNAANPQTLPQACGPVNRIIQF